MRRLFRFALPLALTVAGPAAALAGAGVGPGGVYSRAPIGIAPPARVVDLAIRGRHLAGQQTARPEWRRNRGVVGYLGAPLVYQQAGEAAPPRIVERASETAASRTVIYNYNGAPPLWQGDAGYVAQPAIYDVGSVLRDHPLPGRRARVVK